MQRHFILLYRCLLSGTSSAETARLGPTVGEVHLDLAGVSSLSEARRGVSLPIRRESYDPSTWSRTRKLGEIERWRVGGEWCANAFTEVQ
jgi:hypothetical protein